MTKLEEIKRLRATIRRLRRNIRSIFESNRPDGGPHLDGAVAATMALEHDEEMRRMLK